MLNYEKECAKSKNKYRKLLKNFQSLCESNNEIMDKLDNQKTIQK